ncbi:MAG: ROK family protein [Gaiellaceae bacterium]
MSETRVVGVDVGGTKILAGVVGEDGSLERQFVLETPLDSSDALLAGLDTAVGAVLDDRVVAIGFGIPSRIDKIRGTVISSVNIPLEGLPLRDRMSERWQMPCGIDNDANAATIAEWKAGAGRGTTEMAMLTLGTGVGGGLILDGRPYSGGTGAAAEVGHMVVEFDGRPCQGTCSGRGHLEAECSGRAATLLAREAFGPAADAPLLMRLAGQGDPKALELLHGIGRRLGAAIGTLANLFNVERVVIGGGFGAAAWSYLIEPAREVAWRESLEPGRSLVEIVPAELGDKAGLVGAGFVAYRALEAALVPSVSA